MKKLLSYFHIVLKFGEMTISDLISFAYGIKTTGNPVIPHPSFTDQQIQDLASTVQTDIGTRASQPNPSLTATEQQDVDELSRAVVSVKSDVEIAANNKARGNRTIFDEIVRSTGFMPKALYSAHKRVFESLPSEANSFHVRVPSAGNGHYTYYYEFGFTTAIDTPPEKLFPVIALPVTELIINGLNGNTIIGIHYSVVHHPKHTKKTANNIPQPDTDRAINKVVTSLLLNSKGKVVVNMQSSFMHYSDFIYIEISGKVK